MNHRLAANLFFALHVAFSLFAVFGALLVLVSRFWLWLHVPVVVWVFLVNAADWPCPLTTLERRFRDLAKEPAPAGFISHYLGARFASLSPRRLEVITGVTVLLWNVALYALLFSRAAGSISAGAAR